MNGVIIILIAIVVLLGAYLIYGAGSPRNGVSTPKQKHPLTQNTTAWTMYPLKRALCLVISSQSHITFGRSFSCQGTREKISLKG